MDTQITFQKYNQLMARIEELENRENKLIERLNKQYSEMEKSKNEIWALLNLTKEQYEKRIKEQKDTIRYLKRRLAKYEE